MKCDELKEIMLVNQVSGERTPSGTYKKAEVDEAINELKAEIDKLNNSFVWFKRYRNVAIELRTIRKDLWLMTAEWADAMGLASCNIAAKFMSKENFEVGCHYRDKTIKKYRHRQVVFCKYADYCRQKAKECK